MRLEIGDTYKNTSDTSRFRCREYILFESVEKGKFRERTNTLLTEKTYRPRAGFLCYDTRFEEKE